MSGFPGETEEEFEKTYKLLEQIKLYKIHVFPYSKREGTKAAEFPDQVLQNIKEERSKKVIELSDRLGKEYRKSYIGKTIKVLVEEKETKDYKGHTSNYIYVKIENAKRDIRNRIVEVKIKSIDTDMLARGISLNAVHKPENK